MVQVSANGPKIRNIADCAKWQLDVGIECCACDRFVVFATDTWQSRFGSKLETIISPLKCANCGSRLHRIRPWHESNRPRDLDRRLAPLYVVRQGRRSAR